MMAKIYKTSDGKYIPEYNLTEMTDDEFLQKLNNYYDKWQTEGLTDAEDLDYENMIECFNYLKNLTHKIIF